MNDQPNESQRRLDAWLGSVKYAYVMASTVAVWRKFRPNSALARRELAAKWRRDCLANRDKIPEGIDLADVDWLELADYQLGMMADYRPLGKETAPNGSRR
jgi:hypothetical protein